MRGYSIITHGHSVKHDDAGLIEPLMATSGLRV
jgi:hypothetical protein